MREDESWMAERLQQLAAADRRRKLQPARSLPGGRVALGGRELLNLCSNDYLGLGAEPAPPYEGPSGAGAARLITGNHPAFAAVERAVAELKGTAAALVFSSGYMANVGVIASLAGRGDVVYADRLDHASIVDGIRLSGARLRRFHHQDTAHLRSLLAADRDARRRLIVVDALYSMDGDFAPLPELVALKREFGAMLMVDEAHSGGVWGPEGRGWAAACDLAPAVDVQMGTFSKAYGVYGAYVAGSEVLVDYLANTARSFIYTTGLPPVVLHHVAHNLRRARAEPWRRQRVQEGAARFRRHLQAAGLDTGASRSQIVPVLLGTDAAAVAAAQALQEAGIAAWPIRPPTVPEGSARLRFSVGAAHEPDALERAAQTVVRVLEGLQLPEGA